MDRGLICMKPRVSFVKVPRLTGTGWVDLGSDLISAVGWKLDGQGDLGGSGGAGRGRRRGLRRQAAATTSAVARSRGSGLDSLRDSVGRLERDARNAAAGLIWRRGGRSGLAVAPCGVPRRRACAGAKKRQPRRKKSRGGSLPCWETRRRLD